MVGVVAAISIPVYFVSKRLKTSKSRGDGEDSGAYDERAWTDILSDPNDPYRPVAQPGSKPALDEQALAAIIQIGKTPDLFDIELKKYTIPEKMKFDVNMHRQVLRGTWMK